MEAKEDMFVTKDLVLIGGGHAHVGVLKMMAMSRRWRKERSKDTRVTVIAKETLTPYSGMLPGYVAGHYKLEECHIDLVPLARLAGARLIHAAAVRLDLERKLVHVASRTTTTTHNKSGDSNRSIYLERPPIEYDVLSINVGITPDTGSVPGAAKYATAVKPIDSFVSRFDKMLLARGAKIAIVGGGAGGVELCLALHHRLLSVEEVEGAQLTLYTRGEILSGHNEYGKRAIREMFSRREVKLVEGAHVLEVLEGKLRYKDAQGSISEEKFDECLWCTQASGASWLRSSGLAIDSKGGFVVVNEYLQSTSHPSVFAVGDCATISGHPRPKAGVFAVRQGAPLMENLSRTLEGSAVALKRYIPQQKYLSLISTGNQYAVGLRGGLGFEGKWVWKLKHWIDTKWMAKYTTEVKALLGNMDGGKHQHEKKEERQQDQARHKMFCAGCGSKVGPDVLSRVLRLLKSSAYESVTSDLGEAEDAAILDLGGGSKQIVHSIDFFRSFMEDPFLFGAITANHALSDIYAMGIYPKAVLAIAVVPYGSPRKLESNLFHMLSGACSTLMAANCKLSGGHSVQGSEMALGFSAVGEVQEGGKILKKSDLRKGQKLILTKGLGTGVLLAGEMKGVCEGRWLSRAIDSMLQPNERAMEIAIGCEATACTDITGFGLVGHLREMVIASKVTVSIDLDAIPILEGARELNRKGVRSSLYEDNLKASDAVARTEDSSDDFQEHYPLLFDPQTSGGLLFGVPASRTESCLAKLRESGYNDAFCIGNVSSLRSETTSRPIVIKCTT